MFSKNTPSKNKTQTQHPKTKQKNPCDTLFR